MTHTGQLVHRGAEAEWTIVSYKLISKMLEGTVFSSLEDKDRAHVTRTSDTSCMIEDDTDDGAQNTCSFDFGKTARP